MDTGSKAETLDECFLLLPSSGLLGYFPYTTQDPQLRGATAHCRLGLPPSVSNPENPPQTCPQANQEATLELRLPLPSCVQLTTKIPTHCPLVPSLEFHAKFSSCFSVSVLQPSSLLPPFGAPFLPSILTPFSSSPLVFFLRQGLLSPRLVSDLLHSRSY